MRPPDIPANTDCTYAEAGWIGYGDWLGTGTIAFSLRKCRPFKKAREFARSLKLNNRAEWWAFCRGKLHHKGRLPSDIPSNPNITYADHGWISIGDWLGTGFIPSRLRQFRAFEEARRFARGLKLRNEYEWRSFCKGKLHGRKKLPFDVPATPSQVYAKKGWIGFGDWLGTGNIANFVKREKGQSRVLTPFAFEGISLPRVWRPPLTREYSKAPAIYC